MSEAFSRKTLLDLAAIFFLLGSAIVLATAILGLPIATVYPLRIREPLPYISLVATVITVLGAILGFDCFHMMSRKKLARAGVRGLVIGAVLVSTALVAGSPMVAAGAVLILISSALCYVYREQAQ
ncbi:hypothetical protein KEJ39_07650 [Candidatus Bathyarchaeota archaeon]|nr:hypothetical protein [Candidatus Bathyarchaeota archaeon]